ncbi:MAG: MFS transporter [Gammaproteobacteria bacterium]|nr:MFS transporter [Gammaproteobacteria bacterium]
MSAPPAATVPQPDRSNQELRATVSLSQREAVASSTMSGICDNFLNAFAIHLNATVPQIAWLTAVPQLLGAWLQLASVWIGLHCTRKRLIVAGAVCQASAVLGMALLALTSPAAAASKLIGLAVLYQAAQNFVQPHWRGWLGGLVPEGRRGRFFAQRTRISAFAGFAAFLLGGLLLNIVDDVAAADLGFAVLFLVALGGRTRATHLLQAMHDPMSHAPVETERTLRHTLRLVLAALRHRAFRDYTIFIAAMQGMVALSVPFFSVYMLRDLHFSYFDYTVVLATSILVQFLTLRGWGRISDRLGNRVVMILTNLLLPTLPALWIVSHELWFLLCIQILSGATWSGFTLSTGNYLYDLRPQHSHFTTYAAVQSGLTATAVFFGAMAGGYLAVVLPTTIELGRHTLRIQSPLLGVFALSGLLRLAVALWFLPRAEEPRVQRRPTVRELVVGLVRSLPFTRIVRDWLTSRRKRG